MDAALHFCVLSGAEDQPFVAALAEGLSAGGWGVWSAADLRAGDDRAAEMQAALGRRADEDDGHAGVRQRLRQHLIPRVAGHQVEPVNERNQPAPLQRRMQLTGGRPIGPGVRDEHIID